MLDAIGATLGVVAFTASVLFFYIALAATPGDLASAARFVRGLWRLMRGRRR